jgi:outer membrane protein TolC
VRSEQGLREAQSKLSTAINVVWSEAISLGTAPATLGLERELPAGIPKLETVLQQWTPYQIALLKHQQAQERLHFAKNQIEPSVDFVLSYSGTGYNNKIQDARMAAEQSAYPDWYFGVNFEFPLNGNQKAQKQFLAQSARVTQAELEILAIQTSFSNDLDVRLSDLKNAQSVLQSSQKEVKLRQAIVDNEQQKTRLGSGLLGTLIQRQVDLIESKQRLLENQVRFEIAMATWQYTQGSLLSDNQIQISDASASDQ